MRSLPLLLLLFACGDPIVDTSYRGEPIWYVEGTINAPEQLHGLSLGDEVRASLFWVPNLNPSSPLQLIEQTSVTAEVRFPATFEVRVFEPPSDEHYVVSDGRYAVAMLLIYVDEDHDGFFSAADRMVGGAVQNALVFARDAVPMEESPSHAALAKGFSVVRPPLDCPETGPVGYGPPPPEAPWACGACPEELRCNVSGFCEPEYPLTITVLDVIPKDILCPPQ